MVSISKLSVVMCIAIALLTVRVQAAPQAKPADLVLTPGTYDVTWSLPDENIMGRGASGLCDFNGEIGNQVKGKPEFKSEKPKYGQIVFDYDAARDGGNKIVGILVALDESGGTGKGYDTLYVDVNRNLDLSDDAKTSWKDGSGQSYSKFVIQLPYKELVGGNVSGLAALDFTLYSSNEQAPYCYFTIRGCIAGQIDSNQGKIPFSAFDTNANGVFGDVWKLTEKSSISGDMLQLRLDTKAEDSLVFGSGDFYWNKALNVAGKLYTFKMNPSGDKLEVARYNGPTAQLMFVAEPISKVKTSVAGVMIGGQQGMYSVSNPTKPFIVPPGSYHFYLVMLQATLAKDQKLMARVQPDAKREIAVKEGKKGTAKFGGKIKMVIRSAAAEILLTPGKDQKIDLSITFPNGDSFGGLYRQDGKNPETKVVLKYPKGKIIDQQKAGFG